MTPHDDSDRTRHRPTSSENPPQVQESNFWTTGKGVLTIIGIAVAVTVVVIAFIVSTLDRDNEFGQEAVYSDQATDSVCDLGGVVFEGSIADIPDYVWVENRGVWLQCSEDYVSGLYEAGGCVSCFVASYLVMLCAC